jgi:RNA polymerase sigma factor (sigma-70 family)
MALQIARTFLRRLPPNVLAEDVEQAALIGLFDGLRRYPDGDGPGFEAYLRMRIRGSIKDELRAQDWVGRRNRSGTAAEPPTVLRFDDVSPNWEDMFGGETEDAETLAIRNLDAAKAWAAPLQERDWRIMRARYQREIKQEHIADALGISPPRVSQREHFALARMRAHLSDP